MTTVARDGKTIAADKRCGYHCMPVEKLRRMKDGSVLGLAGDDGAICREVAICLDNASQLPALGDQSVETLRVFRDGRAEKGSGSLGVIPVLMPFFAIGSGADYAMGAMAMGATAEQAVEVASRFDKSTGGGIDTIEVSAPDGSPGPSLNGAQSP